MNLVEMKNLDLGELMDFRLQVFRKQIIVVHAVILYNLFTIYNLNILIFYS